MKKGITGITMGCGNVLVLKETLKSFSTICDEIVYGDMLLFDEDRVILNSYKSEFNLKIIKMPFNNIFLYGFSTTLNTLSACASNNLILYLNTSEIIEVDNGVIDSISPEYNCYYFDHGTDPHRWFRFYDRRELRWSGYIHESLEPFLSENFRPFHKPVFRMADLEKDMQSAFKAAVFNDAKEINYFRNYMTLVDYPVGARGATDPGWYKFAEENYASMLERLQKKGERFDAFKEGDLDKYINDVYNNPEFEKQRFESNIGIEYQGDKKYLL